MRKSNKQDVDAMVTYVFLKKLMTPVFSTDAYRLKLVDNAGRIIREPETDIEKESLTLLDKLIYKMRRLLGTRVANLYNFLYLQTLGQNVYNNLIVMGSTAQRAEIKRIAKDFKRLQESYDISTDDFIYNILTEEIANGLEKEILNESE